MIHLTRLNNNPLTVNSDLIKFVEQSPDTVITLLNGEKIIVRESADAVLQRIVQFRRTVLEGIYPASGCFASVAASSETRPTTEDEAKR